MALLLIERQCAIRNREKIAEASRLANAMKISQRALRPKPTKSNPSHKNRKFKDHSSTAAEISDPDMNEYEKSRKLNDLFADNIEGQNNYHFSVEYVAHQEVN